MPTTGEIDRIGRGQGGWQPFHLSAFRRPTRWRVRWLIGFFGVCLLASVALPLEVGCSAPDRSGIEVLTSGVEHQLEVFLRPSPSEPVDVTGLTLLIAIGSLYAVGAAVAIAAFGRETRRAALIWVGALGLLSLGLSRSGGAIVRFLYDSRQRPPSTELWMPETPLVWAVFSVMLYLWFIPRLPYATVSLSWVTVLNQLIWFAPILRTFWRWILYGGYVSAALLMAVLVLLTIELWASAPNWRAVVRTFLCGIGPDVSRRNAGGCPQCDYPRTGIASERCPECGSPWTETSDRIAPAAA